MRLIIAAVGRLKSGPSKDLFQDYSDRINPAGSRLAIGPFSVHEISESRLKTADERKRAEGQLLLEKCSKDSLLISLDERGKELSSREFARFLSEQRQNNTPSLEFLIGGADGLDEAVKSRSFMKLSFGRMTLPHGLIRIVLAEQIYRALTILSGHPYHRD